MRIGAAHREFSRSRGQLFLAPGYTLAPRDLLLRNFSTSTLPSGAHVWYKARDGLWWLGKIAHRAPPDVSSRNPPDPSSGSAYIVRFLDDPGPIKIDLQASSLHYRPERSSPGRGAFNALGMGAYPVGWYGTLMLPAVPLPFQLPPLVSFRCLVVFGDSAVVLRLVFHRQPLIYNSFESTTSWLGLPPTVASGMILHTVSLQPAVTLVVFFTRQSAPCGRCFDISTPLLSAS